MRWKSWKLSWYICFLKLNHLRSPTKHWKITLFLYCLSSISTLALLCFVVFGGGHSTGIHSGNAILLKFVKNYLCVQLAGWSPCSTAAFSAGKPNASHPIGFITCQQKGKTQSYIIFWNGINNTHRPLNNNRCFASK